MTSLITVTVKVKRGRQELGKSKMHFCEGAYTPAELQSLYLPVTVSRALAQAVDSGMRCGDDAH